MKRWIVVSSFFLLTCLLVSCGYNGRDSSSTSSESPILVVTTPGATATPRPPATPGATRVPTATATPLPTPQATATRPPTGHRCTLQSCPNPWGFLLGCACGKNWPKLYSTPAGFCTYFACISNFFSGHGSVAACMDGMLSHEGDLPGVCIGHGGMMADLYHYVSPPPVPTPTPPPTPTPTP